ncbi:MAG TPA: serine hydrolase domain-containing protein [Pyrinomonadaceae bacterium]|jgi:CubicO group peptidase (beta-lactamase class C family)
MKRKKLQAVIFTALSFCLTIASVFAQGAVAGKINVQSGKSTVDDSIIVRGSLGQALDQYLKRLEAYGFSGSLLVAKNGQIVLSKGYGLADRERSIPVTPTTLFEGASLNKQFTAAAIMKLEQMGKLRVEDSIDKYFDNVPEDKKSITLHHLMTHSAGFPNEFSQPGVDYYKNPEDYYFKDRDTFVREILKAPLKYPIGTRAGYSNPSYSLVAAVIEKVSGQSYESFVREHLFAPAGLTNTAFNTEIGKWNPRQIARGFNGTIEIERASYKRHWGSLGAGGVLSSTTDLYKWEMALRGEKILSAKSKEKMFGARVPSGGGFDYAYGWRVHKSPRGTNIIWASGLVPEFSAMFQRYVEEDVTIIFFTNNSLNGFPLRDVLVIPGREAAIERIVFGKEYTLPPWFIETDANSLKAYAGVYKTAAGEEFIVSADGNSLRLAPRSQAAADRLIPPISETPAPDYAKYHEQIEKGLADYKNGKRQEAEKEITFEGEKLEKQFGRFLEIERMVTVPEIRNKGTHQATTYAELKFERGVVSYRWHWWDGDLYERQKPKPGRQLSFLPPFRRQSLEEFVTFHITLGASLRVRFEMDNSGKVRSLTIANPKGSVKAMKL